MKNTIHIVAAALIIVGFGMMALARYKIRTICEKYPVEIQMRDFPACVKYGGPWPQKTERAKPMKIQLANTRMIFGRLEQDWAITNDQGQEILRIYEGYALRPGEGRLVAERVLKCLSANITSKPYDSTPYDSTAPQ